ncbi:hypothetical protein AC1031_008140 [Aphanomyces cochlioides]|nr:hypothetical protein AC1031_008140 [Aphanomyces cochlioides]
MKDFLQVNKARGGDVVVSVTSEETRLAMLGQTVSILGNDYKVATPRTGGKSRNMNTNKQNGLEELYYMDIVGTGYNFDSLALDVPEPSGGKRNMHTRLSIKQCNHEKHCLSSRLASMGHCLNIASDYDIPRGIRGNIRN